MRYTRLSHTAKRNELKRQQLNPHAEIMTTTDTVAASARTADAVTAEHRNCSIVTSHIHKKPHVQFQINNNISNVL